MTIHPLLEKLEGNDEVKVYLSRMVERNRIGNSLLFSGPDDTNKEEFAQVFAAIVLGEGNASRVLSNNHPDIHHYRPEGKSAMHSIDALRAFGTDVLLSPFEASRKVFIIHDAERMLPWSANALLKTFEEPPLDTVIILLTSAPELLLETILSRCRRVPFKPLKRSLKNPNDPLRKKMLERLAIGRFPHYGELKDFATELGSAVDASKAEIEKEVRESLIDPNFTKELNSKQSELLEKEVAGAAAMKGLVHIDTLLNSFSTWFRDIVLIQKGGDRALLFNSDFEDFLKKASQDRALVDIERVQEAVRETRTSIQRYTPTASALETLFLTCDLL